METEGNPMNTEVRKTFVESQSLGTVEDTSECVLQHPGTIMKTSLEERSLKNPSPRWWLPILLAIPSLIPLISSFIMARLNGFVATGFVQYDQPYYMASARAYFDQGFHFLFGNPYAGYDTPRLYFQPHLFLLGCFQQLGLDPGITWNIFGLVGALFVAFVAVHFYCEVVGWHSRAEKLGLLCFFWGGGVLVLVGFVYACFVGRFNSLTLLHFDPTLGWWMLNFGRNLVYGPTEAYYHGVFLLCMLFLIRRRFGVAIAFAVLLSFSHPWTGIECSVIVASYLLVERLYGDKSVKARYLFASIALVFAHLGYYMVFLNRFADHRALQSQWEANGSVRLYPSYVFLPALFIVGSFALVRLIRWPGFRRLVQDPRNRLFMVWFLIVFGITQHYRVMRPIDPIHFAHGYDWMALFFLGSPLLVAVPRAPAENRSVLGADIGSIGVPIILSVRQYRLVRYFPEADYVRSGSSNQATDGGFKMARPERSASPNGGYAGLGHGVPCEHIQPGSKLGRIWSEYASLRAAVPRSQTGI